jgi:hypothetical protein
MATGTVYNEKPQAFERGYSIRRQESENRGQMTEVRKTR